MFSGGGRRGTGALHLLWALPVAVLVTLGITLVAGVAACGVSGCSGGGFGRSTDLQPLAVVLVLVAGAVLAAPPALVPWTPHRAVRAGCAVVVGLGWAGFAWLSITGVL
ncbi:hypothetical protein N866_02305 [Actinotalea ferrariae CF5-4]|uniref:Transmembrane protein n=1 Tax=Actinotalea ferrariae CF5-4 TaxID=948458 RepID=A0A021VPX8_9CELL|nr:hypothetical protein N866_02305 [Actinotalea ferrariae CF5-4]